MKIKQAGLTICALSLLFLSVMPAQAGGVKGWGRDLPQLLDLTAAQRTQLDELNESMRVQKEQYREAGEKPDREEIKAQYEAYGQAVEVILTSEQLAQLKEIKAAGKGRGCRGQKGGFGLKGLDLTEDQKAQLKGLWEGVAEEMKQAHESGQRPTPEERQARRQSMRDAVEGILTSEQRQLFEERRASRGGGKGEGAISDNAGRSGFESAAESPGTAITLKSWGQVKAEQK